ncbi:hypothetical protein [Microbacterium sp. CH12i]|uniref:hypothetical protein n=1 Tax=Microbacterium sp. CH12i TaxID=1479651 RepID=UPI000A51E351|nr:hypothetical protein [Microbacterium sp. CH12i]
MNTTITHSSTTLTWKQADDNVHVATRDGEFAGFVESDGTAHVVRDNHGAERGTFANLAEARCALEGTPRRATRPIRQTLRRHLSRARS